jgi:hypothetical protein
VHRLSFKNTLAVVVSLSLIALAAIPLLVPPEQLPRWRLFIVIVTLIGVIGVFWQLSVTSREENEQRKMLQNLEAIVSKGSSIKVDPKADLDGPFLTVRFPTEDLFDETIRDHYLFIQNIGKRPALDVQVATLSRTWNGNVYEAKFPHLQILEAVSKPVPITPTVSINGESLPVFSLKSRIAFSELLIGEDEQLYSYESEQQIVHHVLISYTDAGIKKTNSAIIGAIYWGVGVSVSVKHQS